MRDQWYGDKRDLVKWGVLLELARRYSAKHVLQVLFYRPNDWAQIEIDGDRVELPEAAVQHFRRAAGISAIQCPARVEVIKENFGDRDEYLQIVLKGIRSRSELPGIVFLDPDTGLAPRVASPKHVLESELAAIWGEMQLGDVLVFYQHQTNRNGTPWIEPKKAQFERALNVVAGRSSIAQAPEIARDVVFFFVEKND